MAKSHYEYVKEFERENYLLRDTWIVVRIDGRGFHRFADHYRFEKPNDIRAINVMNDSATALLKSMPEIVMAYGQSDEYSFLLRKNAELFERREAKLVSTFASTFTAFYMAHWPKYFTEQPLDMSRLPTFDARCVVYPNIDSVMDYFKWRQIDCYINNIHNTAFWNLVLKGGVARDEAQKSLETISTKEKNEVLFQKFGINYNNEPDIYRKGTIVVRDYEQWDATAEPLSKRQLDRLAKKSKISLNTLHVEIVKDSSFWSERPWLFA